MKKILFAALVLSMAVSVKAEVNQPRPEDRPLRPLQQLKDARNAPVAPKAEMRADIKAEVTDFKADRNEIRADVKADIQKNRIETKQKIEAMRASGEKPDLAQIKAHMEARKEAAMKLRAEFKTKMEARRAEFKDAMKKRLAEFKANKVKLAAQKKENVAKHVNNAFERLSVAVENIAKFNAKLEAQIDALEEGGADVDVSAELLLDANEALEAARVEVAAVKEAAKEEMDDAEGTAKEALRAAVEKALDAVKAAKEASRKVIQSLPKLEVEAEASAEASN